MRVVLYGPPRSGKSSRLVTFARHRAQRVQFPIALNGLEDPEPWSRRLMLSLSAADNHIDFVTMASAVWDDEPWMHLFAGAGGMMVFPDAQESQEEANRST